MSNDGPVIIFVSCVALYSTGHWIGGTVLAMVIALDMYMEAKK